MKMTDLYEVISCSLFESHELTRAKQFQWKRKCCKKKVKKKTK